MSDVTPNSTADRSIALDESFLDAIHWNADGLIPAIAQDAESGDILMVAWMNREALTLTVRENRAVYWSRSRGRLWYKGEESGHVQTLREVRLDCDGDVLVLRIEQIGGIACHTGRRSCFFRVLRDGRWLTVEPVLKNPDEIYR
jgi:phosphoribosyl-AMP cyclohydrolase